MPSLTVVTRDYPNVAKMMAALGPGQGLRDRAKGVLWNAAEEYEELKAKLGVVQAPGVTNGMPDLSQPGVRLRRSSLSLPRPTATLQ